MPRDGELETAVTLLLADQAPELAAAHDELYPMRVEEGIPLSVTLLYPFAPAAELDEDRLAMLRHFFSSRHGFAFDIRGIAQWEEGGAVYGVPEPDQQLRSTMRALWELFPEFPPYGRADRDPPPHVSLTLDDGGDREATRGAVERRLAGLLPAHFEIGEAALIEEHEPDRWRVREQLLFAQGQR